METTPQSIVLVINDSPYGCERPYNALRLGMSLVRHAGAQVRVFLIGDGVNCAICNQQTPDGYYNVERMVRALTQRGEVYT